MRIPFLEILLDIPLEHWAYIGLDFFWPLVLFFGVPYVLWFLEPFGLMHGQAGGNGIQTCPGGLIFRKDI